jgi:hypothetical protein
MFHWKVVFILACYILFILPVTLVPITKCIGISLGRSLKLLSSEIIDNDNITQWDQRKNVQFTDKNSLTPQDFWLTD